MKSNASAVMKIIATYGSAKTIARSWKKPWLNGDLAVFHEDGLDDVGHVFALVGRKLEVLVDVLPLDHLERILRLPVEQVVQGIAQDLVGVVFELVDLRALPRDRVGFRQVAQERDRDRGFFRAAHDDA